jgi:hypothetical protein
MTKPTAREFERFVRVKDKRNDVFIVTSEVEVVRKGWCPDHMKSTTSFQGVNEHGWLFVCAGRAKDDDGNELKLDPHWIINHPAEERQKVTE